MSWNYRLMAEICPSGELYINIHTVYYHEDGTPRAYSAEPTTIGGEDKSEVKRALNWMQEALKKPILWKGDKFPKECKIEAEKNNSALTPNFRQTNVVGCTVKLIVNCQNKTQ